MTITYATLVMIATMTMLATQRFPTTNEKWEELGRYAQTWGKLKELYKKAEKQARVKRQDLGGHDKLGGDVLGAGAGGDAAPGRRGNPVKIDELEGCFYSLATAATTGKIMLDELVKTNSTLTPPIADLDTTNNRLTKEVAIVSQEVKKYKKGGQEVNDRRGKLAKYCPNCRRDTWHDPDDCFEPEKNAHKLHPR